MEKTVAIKNKKGFTDMEVWMSPGVVLLTLFGWLAVVLGWIWSKKSLDSSLPLWQVIVIMIVIALASYYFVNKD